MVVDTLLAGEREPVITHWVKGATARAANLLLGRTGQVFWQDESDDHWVRNGPELEKKVRYIEWNPVRAGLASVLEGWPWSSARLPAQAKGLRHTGREALS